eukprot:gene11617-10074_t
MPSSVFFASSTPTMIPRGRRAGMPPDRAGRVVLVGDSGVGKSRLAALLRGEAVQESPAASTRVAVAPAAPSAGLAVDV